MLLLCAAKSYFLNLYLIKLEKSSSCVDKIIWQSENSLLNNSTNEIILISSIHCIGSSINTVLIPSPEYIFYLRPGKMIIIPQIIVLNSSYTKMSCSFPGAVNLIDSPLFSINTPCPP